METLDARSGNALCFLSALKGAGAQNDSASRRVHDEDYAQEADRGAGNIPTVRAEAVVPPPLHSGACHRTRPAPHCVKVSKRRAMTWRGVDGLE